MGKMSHDFRIIYAHNNLSLLHMDLFALLLICNVFLHFHCAEEEEKWQHYDPDRDQCECNCGSKMVWAHVYSSNNYAKMKSKKKDIISIPQCIIYDFHLIGLIYWY